MFECPHLAFYSTSIAREVIVVILVEISLVDCQALFVEPLFAL